MSRRERLGLADYAFEAAPEDTTICKGVAEFYDRRAAAETSLMAENLFAAAAGSARRQPSGDLTGYGRRRKTIGRTAGSSGT
jgi:hypothetical protein